MKRVLFFPFVALLCALCFAQESDQKVAFRESWSYVVAGYESEVNRKSSITDLCYFSADVNEYGEISSVPKREDIPSWYTGRVHLVTTCESRSLSHFVIDPKYKVTKKIIRALVKASEDYDGLQIDWELIPSRDAANYQKFLKSLRKALDSDKMLTICVHARTRAIEGDVEDYATLAPLVDRIFIMAYDEHWGGSSPGAVSSMDWCGRVTDWGLKTIPREKLIVGLPFYGRSWVSPSLAKAWYHSGITRIARENGSPDVVRTGEIPHFSFKTQVRVEGWYDDAHSLVARCLMLKDKGVQNVGFWRLGQEDPAFWDHLSLE